MCVYITFTIRTAKTLRTVTVKNNINHAEKEADNKYVLNENRRQANRNLVVADVTSVGRRIWY